MGRKEAGLNVLPHRFYPVSSEMTCVTYGGEGARREVLRAAQGRAHKTRVWDGDATFCSEAK